MPHLLKKFNKEQFYFLISLLTSWVINLLSRNKEPQSILVIKMDEIGDMVYALPVFEHISNRYPTVPITLLCKPFVEPMVRHNPFLSKIIHALPNQTHFDLIIELRGHWETLKFALKHKPNRRLDRGTIRIKNKFMGGQKHEILTNFQIIEPLLPKNTWPILPEIYLDKITLQKTETFISTNHLNAFAVLHCGARRKLRQWPSANYAQLARHLIETYQYKIVFAGTDEDETMIEEIMNLGKFEALVCTENFSLLDFAALVSKASLFVGNESGPIHIAAIMNTPLVGIYGPGVTNIFYPIGNKAKVVHHILDCNPCDQIHCVRPENPCINLVTQIEVQETISKILTV
jgi:ADP-heptose:LPS heptosyltransferase